MQEEIIMSPQVQEIGYTEEKANRLIEEHIEEAARLEQEAKKAEEDETFDRRYSEELRARAQKERTKADNLKRLKEHWNDPE
jgi:hypothetical protein